MSERPVHLAVDAGEDWAVFTAEPAPGGPLLIEYTSRGDRVPASLWRPLRPSGGGPDLVILLAGALDAGHADSASQLAGEGAFVLAPDLPLRGRRASPKLSAQLDGPRGPGDLEPEERDRLVAAARDQGVADVRRGLEVLALLHPETRDLTGELIGADDFAASVAAGLAESEPRLTLRSGG